MDLADARATAMAWSIPSQVPRIEHGGPVIAIELSQLGMDILGVNHVETERTQAEDVDPCLPVAADERYSVTAYFDPRRGRHIGHALRPAPDALWSVAHTRLDHVRVTPTPRSSPTPTGARTPRPTRAPKSSPPLLDPAWEAMPLDTGEYPAPLQDVVRTWPLVEGSQWTYQVTSHRDALEWATWIFTETVVSATLRPPDVMEIRLDREPRTRQLGGRSPWGSGSASHHRVLLADRIIAFISGEDTPSSRDELRSVVPPRGEEEQRDHDLYAALRLPIRADENYNYYWRTEGREHVEGPAGVFPDSVLLTEIRNAGNTWGHWLYPGVGIVRHELPGCSTSYGGYTVYELIDWHIPPLRAVE